LRIQRWPVTADPGTSIGGSEWQEGDPADSRIEYRGWVNFGFRITGTKKERVRAFLEIARDGKPSASWRNAEIAGYDWHGTRYLISDPANSTRFQRSCS
jgi:hypothetical protein